MKFLAVTLFWLVCAAAAWAQERAIPEKVTAKTNALVVIEAKAKGAVSWDTLLPPDQVYVDECSKRLVLTFDQPGTFRILCITCEDGKPSATACQVVIEGKPVPPPPPPPDDLFTQKLKTAWMAEAAADKDQSRKLLASLYRKALQSAPPEKTLGELYATLAAAGQQLLGTKLLGLRQEIGKDLQLQFPQPPGTALDAGLVQRLQGAFNRIAKVLEDLP